MTVILPKKTFLDKLLYFIFKEERQIIKTDNNLQDNPYKTITASKEPLISYLKRVLRK
jgi:hypothetical protein